MLITNFDQTSLQLVQYGNSKGTKKFSSNVTIVDASTCAIAISGKFLPIQLIYRGKTTQSLPRYHFPAGFSLSVNEKHFCNCRESVKFLNEIIVSYVKNILESKDLGQITLVMMDVFTGQITSDGKEVIQDTNRSVTAVPANITRFYQPKGLSQRNLMDGNQNRYLESYSVEHPCKISMSYCHFQS